MVLLRASRSPASNDLLSTNYVPGIALSHKDATEVILDPDIRDLQSSEEGAYAGAVGAKGKVASPFSCSQSTYSGLQCARPPTRHLLN